MLCWLLVLLVRPVQQQQAGSLVPRITEQPGDLVVAGGGTGFLRCRHAPPGSVVSWHRAAGRVAGRVLGDGTLVLAGAGPAQAGRYWCRVRAGGLTVQSRPARVEVGRRPARPEIPQIKVKCRECDKTVAQLLQLYMIPLSPFDF